MRKIIPSRRVASIMPKRRVSAEERVLMEAFYQIKSKRAIHAMIRKELSMGFTRREALTNVARRITMQESHPRRG